MKIFDWLYATILFDMNMKIETLYIINSMSSQTTSIEKLISCASFSSTFQL